MLMRSKWKPADDGLTTGQSVRDVAVYVHVSVFRGRVEKIMSLESGRGKKHGQNYILSLGACVSSIL